MSSRAVKQWGCGGRGFIRKNIDNLRVHARPLTQHLNRVEHVNIYDYDSIGRTLSKHGFEWIGTDRVMAWANCPIPFLKNTRTIIRFLMRSSGSSVSWIEIESWTSRSMPPRHPYSEGVTRVWTNPKGNE